MSYQIQRFGATPAPNKKNVGDIIDDINNIEIPHIPTAKEIKDRINKEATEFFNRTGIPQEIQKDIDWINKQWENLQKSAVVKYGHEAYETYYQLKKLDAGLKKQAALVASGAKKAEEVAKVTKEIEAAKKEVKAVQSLSKMYQEHAKTVLKGWARGLLDQTAIGAIKDLQATIAKSKETIHTAFATIGKGLEQYNTVYQKSFNLAVDARKPAMIYDEMLAYSKVKSETQMTELASKLKALEEVKDIAAQERLIAEALIPSKRYIYMAKDIVNTSSKALEFGKLEYMLTFGWVRDAGAISLNLLKAGAFKGLEKVFGEAFSTGALFAAEMGKTIITNIGKAAMSTAVQLGIVVAETIRSLIQRHNFLDFINAAIFIFTLGLGPEHFIPTEIMQDKYKDYGSLRTPDDKDFEKDKTLHLHTGFMEDISVEVVYPINFWAEEYFKTIDRKHPGFKSAPYKPIPEPELKFKIDGRYIDLRWSPQEMNERGVTEEEIEKAHRLENWQEIGGGFNASLVALAYPVHKADNPKSLRNLGAWPVFNNTVNWPKPEGNVYIANAELNEVTFDPRLLALFKEWATTGTWGSNYHSATTKAGKEAAAAYNKLDYENYMNRILSEDTFYVEMNIWLENNAGKRGARQWDVLSIDAMRMNDEYSDMATPQPPTYHPGSFLHWEYDLVEGRKIIHQFKKQYGRWPCWRHWFKNTYSPTFSGKYGLNMAESLYRRYPGEFDDWYNIDGPKSKLVTSAHLDLYSPDFFDYDGFWVYPLINAWNKYAIQFTTLFEIKHSGDEIALSKFVDKVSRESFIQDQSFAYGGQRTTFTYIKKYMNDFVQDLRYRVKFMSEDEYNKANLQYMESIHKQKPPLGMSTYHRLYYVAQFTQLAFLDMPNSREEFMRHVRESTGHDLIEDQMITTMTPDRANAEKWFNFAIDTYYGVPAPSLVSTFGDYHCRLMLTNNPLTLFVVFRHETSFQDWAVTGDFTASDYIEMKPRRSGPSFISDVYEDAKAKAFPPKKAKTSPAVATVHGGFLNVWKSLEIHVLDAIDAMVAKYPEIDTIVVSGHAMGGSVAQIASLHLPAAPKTKNRPLCYAFASLPCGDIRFSNLVNNNTAEAINVWVDGDISVQLPPFLLPDPKKAKSLNKEAVTFLDGMGKENKDLFMKGILATTNIFGKVFHVPTAIFSPAEWADAKGNFSFHSVVTHAKEILKASNDYRALRGGSVFLRINPNAGTAVETDYDPGNSMTVWGMMGNAIHMSEYSKSVHDLGTLVNQLQLVYANHPEMFDAGNAGVPKWSDAGQIKPPPMRPLPNSIQLLLNRDDVVLLGYGKTRSSYRTWDRVDPEDIVPGSYVDQPHISAEEALYRYKRSAKRRKISKSTYNFF